MTFKIFGQIMDKATLWTVLDGQLPNVLDIVRTLDRHFWKLAPLVVQELPWVSVLTTNIRRMCVLVCNIPYCHFRQSDRPLSCNPHLCRHVSKTRACDLHHMARQGRSRSTTPRGIWCIKRKSVLLRYSWRRKVDEETQTGSMKVIEGRYFITFRIGNLVFN